MQTKKNSTKWDLLSDELVILIFSFLDVKSICKNLPVVNSRFKRLSEDDRVWKQCYQKHYDNVILDETSSNFKYLFMIEVLDGKIGSQRFPMKKKSGWCSNCDGTSNSTSSQSLFIRLIEKENPSRINLHQGAKLVILGDVNTGKTSILVRLVKGLFVSYHEATIGASFLTKQLIVEDVPVKFEIWDTAGSERYYSLAPMYYRGAVAAIVVYDITSDESYERAIKWVAEVEQIDSKPVVTLVGNKIDLEKSRVIQTATARNYATENGLLFAETSAKTGEGIINIFVQIAKELIAKADREDKERQKINKKDQNARD